MAITLITGPANAGKAQVVMDEVRAHLARGEEPLLVVPTRADADHYLRELAGAGSALGARVELFDGLIGEAVRRAGVAEPLLGEGARRRALAAIAGRARGGPGAAGFVRALAGVIAELQVRRVSPPRLSEALASWLAAEGGEAHAGEHAAELGRVFARYRRLLEQIGRVDAEQRAVHAFDGLRREPALWGGTPVLFYGFDDLTRLQIDAIETLGAVVGAAVTVSLSYEPGRTAFAGRAATFQALAPSAAEHRALDARADYYAPGSRAALSHLERSLFEADVAQVDPAGAIRLLEGGGERAELELVAGEIGRLLAGGIAPEEIAVVVRAPAARADLLEEVFAVAGIPYALRRARPFADSAIGSALLGLLRSVPHEGEHAGSAGDLLAWLRAPGLLEHPELADRLELTARRAGAGSAAQARRLWEQRHWRLEAIDRLHAAAERDPPRGRSLLIERAARELEWLFCAPRRGTASVLAGAELDEARALAAGRRALGELRELARVAPELVPRDAAELAGALEQVEFFSGEGPTPGCVALLDPLALRARRVRAMFVCGLQEGVFPAPAPAQPYFSEEERRRLAETSGLRLGEHEDALAAERYLLYAAVSRPEELLCLSWHLADDDGEPTARSLFVDDVCDLFLEGLDGGSQPGAHLRRALGAVDPPVPSRVPAARVEGPRRVRDERLLAELRERPWSASSLEALIGCPARWFVERVLAPGRFDPDPEPLARGGLAHEALRETLEGLRRETGSARVSAGSLALARELLARALREQEAARPVSVAEERRAPARRRLQADLERYLEHAAAGEGSLEPAFLELGFGFAAEDERGGGEARPAVDLGDGVSLRGRIDRIDVAPDGRAVVYDYKSSAAPGSASWIKGGSVQVALYMHAAEALLGVEAVGGFYQPLSGDLRARGLLDKDADLKIECVKGDAREHAEVRELMGEARALALRAAAGARAGEFPSRPATCAWRGGCLHPGICRCES